MNQKYLKYFLFFISLLFIYLLYLKDSITYFFLFSIKKINQYCFLLKHQTHFYKLLYEYKKLEREYYKLFYLKQIAAERRGSSSNDNLYKRNYLSADIIGFVNHGKDKFFIINKGSIDGIIKNMVVVDGIILLGKVLHVYSHYSKVIALDNDEQYISVVFTKNNNQGILKGNNSQLNGTMSLIHKYHEIKNDIEIGEKVYSSGKGLVYPAGYFIGTVLHNNKINCFDNDIAIKMGYDIDRLEECQIIIEDEEHFKNIEELRENT